MTLLDQVRFLTITPFNKGNTVNDKYELSNTFYNCFIGKLSEINIVAKVALYPIFILGYFVWLSLDFLFVWK